MEPIEYEAMYELEDTLWWYRGQRKMTAALFDKFMPAAGTRPLRILDCGAGTGGSLQLLSPLGDVYGFDFSDLAVDLYRRRESGHVAQASVSAIPFADATFDLVTAFDLLTAFDPPEHEDGLREMARVTKPGGYVFWREAAFMFLYGPHDLAGHVRHRYNARELRQGMEKHGLRPLRVSYSNTFLFPVAAARRLTGKLRGLKGSPRSDVRPVPAPLNSVLTAVLGLEAPLVAKTGLPFGLSVLALAQKQP
jgi:SAM-dependent methyltransferase